jgi:hypothetical protein
MTTKDLIPLGKLFDLLREKGVRSFRSDALHIEMSPEAPVAANPEALREVLEKASQSEDGCKCGHPEYAHNAGLCLQGCDEEKCHPPEATQ